MARVAPSGLLVVYRIVRAGYPVFDGSGAARWGGRWTSPGRAVIHTAETYALAVLENFVHFNLGVLPPHLVVSRIEIPPSVPRQVIRRADVPDFDEAANYDSCRVVGDAWHAALQSAVLLVPSRLSPFEGNVLIHPGHRDIAKVQVGDPQPARLDDRLAGLLARGPTSRSRPRR